MNDSGPGGWRRLALPLILLLSTLLASCAPAGEARPPQPELRVTLVMKMKHNDYWRSVQTGAEAAAKEFNVRLTVKATDDEEDVSGQLTLMDEVLREGADALIVAANDYEALAAPVDRAAAQRIPVITLDSEVHSGRVLSFVGINNYAAGSQAGEKLAELTGRQGKVAVVVSGKGAKNMAEREQGLLAALARYPGLTLAAREDCSADAALCEQMTETLVRQRVDGIVALNAVTSVAVARRVNELKAGGALKLVTFDSTPEELEWLQEGVIQTTIVQNTFSMGYLSVKSAVEATAGRKLAPRVETETKAIDVVNMFWPDNQKLLFPFVK